LKIHDFKNAFKARLLVFFVSLAIAPFLSPRLALAADPLPPVTPSSIASSIVTAIQEVGMPLGGALLLLSVIITAVQIIISRFNPGQRENAMSNLWYVGLGGILLGGALFFASLFYNIGGTYFR
jgi:hypothetical protein